MEEVVDGATQATSDPVEDRHGEGVLLAHVVAEFLARDTNGTRSSSLAGAGAFDAPEDLLPVYIVARYRWVRDCGGHGYIIKPGNRYVKCSCTIVPKFVIEVESVESVTMLDNSTEKLYNGLARGGDSVVSGSEWLAQAMSDQGLTYRDVAHKAGVSATTICNVVKGVTKRPSPELIDRIADAVNRGRDEARVAFCYLPGREDPEHDLDMLRLRRLVGSLTPERRRRIVDAVESMVAAV